ncbi:unnamed protein product [Paramecium pentaurelia]|uniref:Transmembrane protein n=1 Tax=Paramecium pentaurelia TaxID=43138 RepID=A0A8S1XG12_9CILI|nr:unnamed protein product [Paramecium pentaurelia]
MKKFYSTIQQLDIFGQTITLNINKESNYKTFFGGISSILIIAILIAFFFSNVMDFLNQTEIIFSLETKFSINPDDMILTSQNYMAAFSIEQKGFAINPYFNISIEQRQYIRDENGKLIKNISYIPLETCTLSHFDLLLNQSDINFQEQYNQLDLSNWLCPKKDFQFKLSGTYSSQEFNFIKIIVNDCIDNKENETGGWNPICASEQAKQQHLQKEGQFKFQIYQVNSVVNPGQPKTYVSSYLDGEMYFTFVPKKMSRQANLFYRKYKFFNDLSLLPLENIHQEEVVVRENSDYRDLTEIGRDTDDNYAIIYLRRSQFTEIVNRRYTQIGELLSYLGGFLQIMITGLGIFIMYYNKIQMQIELSNKLYNFKISPGKEQNQMSIIKPSQISNAKGLSLSVEDSQNQNLNDSLVDEKYKKNYLKKAIIKQFQQMNQISLSMKLILNQITFGLLFNNNDSQFLNKAINKVNNDLNIHDILYKIQEIQKLKHVLLRRSQIILFNFTPKPLITLDEDYQLPNRMDIEENLSDLINSNFEEKNEKNLFTDIYHAYLEIKKELDDESMPFCQFQLNAQLALELGPQMQEIFKNQEQIENQEKVAFSIILKSVNE